MKRVAAVAALSMAAAVTACGGSSNNAAGGTSPSASAALPKLTGTTINVIGKWSGDEQKSFLKVLDDFKAKTGATVNFTSSGDNTPTVLGTRIAAGNPPDVAILPQPGLLQQFATKGNLIKLPDNIVQIVKDSYSKSWQDLASSGGTMYGVWFKGANKSTIWYRTDAFTQAGITNPPTTWDEFVKDLGTLRDSGVNGPVSSGGGDGWTLTDLFENIYLRTAGAEKYDQLTNHKIPWTDPSVKEALTIMSAFWKQKNLFQPNALQTTFADSVTQAFGTNKKGAVVIEGDFAATNITQSTKSKPGVDAKFFAFPSVKGSQPAVVGAGDVAVMMKNNKGAQALLQYLASPESASIWAGLGGFTSPNSKVPASAYSDDVARASADQLVKATTFRFDLSDLTPAAFGGTPGQGMWKDLQDMYANPSSVDSTAKKLESQAKAAYK